MSALQDDGGPSVEEILKLTGETDEPDEVEAPESEAPEATEAPETPEGAEPEPELEPEPETTTEGETDDSVDEDDLEKAYEILRRDGWKTRQLTKLAQQDVLDLAAHRSKVQRDVDEAFQERNRLRNTAKEPAEVTEEPGAKETPSSPPATPSLADLKEAARPFAEAIENAEDPSEALVAFAQQAFSAQSQELAQRLGESEKRSEFLESALTDMLLDQAKARVVERIPQLQDGDLFEKVQKAAIEMGKTEMFANKRGVSRIEALLNAAAKIELPDAPSADELERQEKLERKKANGSVAPVQKRTVVSKKPKNNDELIAAKIRMAEEGYTPAEIVRELG